MAAPSGAPFRPAPTATRDDIPSVAYLEDGVDKRPLDAVFYLMPCKHLVYHAIEMFHEATAVDIDNYAEDVLAAVDAALVPPDYGPDAAAPNIHIYRSLPPHAM